MIWPLVRPKIPVASTKTMAPWGLVDANGHQPPLPRAWLGGGWTNSARRCRECSAPARHGFSQLYSGGIAPVWGWASHVVVASWWGGCIRFEGRCGRKTNNIDSTIIAPATSMKIRWRSIAILWHEFAAQDKRKPESSIRHAAPTYSSSLQFHPKPWVEIFGLMAERG